MKLTILTIAIVALVAVSAMANNPKTVKEITELRAQVVTAIKEKNRKFLESRIADEFTHTHASGKVDDKRTRIDYLLGGDETIDSLAPVTVSIKAFGKDLAIAQGRTKTSGSSPKTFQWTTIYRKTGGVWRVLFSQASPVVE